MSGPCRIVILVVWRLAGNILSQFVKFKPIVISPRNTHNYWNSSILSTLWHCSSGLMEHSHISRDTDTLGGVDDVRWGAGNYSEDLSP